MQISGRTILVTGGASGIGRGLAERFQQLGAKVIIAGRRQALLDEVTAANPGMAALAFDVADAASVEAFAAQVARDHPALDTLVNNAGVMRREDLTGGPAWLATAEATIATNLLGPLRLTAALLPHLRTQPRSAVVNVTSGLAFVPQAASPTYSATKAALHSWTQSLRWQLKDSTTEVVEVAPPYVQTELNGPQQAVDPAAMPLDAFLSETLAGLQQEPTPPEVLVERVGVLRRAEAEGRHDMVFQAMNSRQH